MRKQKKEKKIYISLLPLVNLLRFQVIKCKSMVTINQY